jgi:hypothetical protein
MTAIWSETIRDTEGPAQFGPRSLLQGIAKCDACHRTSMGISYTPANAGNGVQAMELSNDETFDWFPSRGQAPAFPDVPSHIAAAARESHAALSINAVMAAILMARTVVEATAKEEGITSGNLVAKIDALATASHIRDSTKDAAHVIRHFGNDMAHGDISDLPSTDDAKEVLTLMDEILNEVFQGPARTARLIATRTASTPTA